MNPPAFRSRALPVDALKAVAAQCIVLHHFAWYGPLSEQAAQLGPALAAPIGGFAAYGRYAVAVFLVLGGYLSALALPPPGQSFARPVGQLILERYLRLVVPFAVALLCAIACNLLARQWMSHESLGSPPQLLQFLAHLLLLHSLLGVESLSAGVWYVAIDLQLYGLFVLLLWLGQRRPCRPATAEFLFPAAGVLVILVGLASLFHFNRDNDWDATPLYFFGAYSLGIAAGWAQRSERYRPWFWGLFVALALALWVDFRDRLALAGATAILLASRSALVPSGMAAFFAYLGRTSYALFLVHFPVYQLVGGAFARAGWEDPAHGLWGIVLSWCLSLLAADQLHRQFEQPFERWRKRRLAAPSGAGTAISR